MAEMAIAVPVFMLVALALFEGGAFALTLTTLENATQRGGRMAALDPCHPSDPSCTPGRVSEADVQAAVVNEAGRAAIALVPADVAITVTRCPPSPCTTVSFATRLSGDRVRIAVNFVYTPLTAVVFGGSATFPLTAATEYNVE